VCPEVLGGLSTPRPPAERRRGKSVKTSKGKYVTKQFKKGAEIALVFAKAAGVERAILKARSPSCGSGEIYDGTFSGKLVKRDGITAELFKANGIEVITEEDPKFSEI
jgi:uncharacterized protein YbbK (DUF523 family)